MKIGILTQHFLLNYGGIIQNFALQQVLLKFGHDPLTFEHDTCYSRTRWLLRTAKQILKTRSLKGLPVYPTYQGRIGNKNFIKFVLKNSEGLYTRLDAEIWLGCLYRGKRPSLATSLQSGTSPGQYVLEFC